MMIVDMSEFLLARIAEDEAVAEAAREHEYLSAARDASALWWTRDSLGYGTIFATSGRVLAECEAKRRIVVEHPLEPIRPPDHLIPWPTGGGCGMCDHDCNTGGDPTGAGPCSTLRALASVYADHPDYQPQWAL